MNDTMIVQYTLLKLDIPAYSLKFIRRLRINSAAIRKYRRMNLFFRDF
jgi:hypothetical protein